MAARAGKPRPLTEEGGEISGVCPVALSLFTPSLYSQASVSNSLVPNLARSVIMFGPRGNIKGLLARRYYTARVPLTNPRVLC